VDGLRGAASRRPPGGLPRDDPEAELNEIGRLFDVRWAPFVRMMIAATVVVVLYLAVRAYG
jgi:hypothetical protein